MIAGKTIHYRSGQFFTEKVTDRLSRKVLLAQNF